ncbi:MAG: phosphate acyltransferase PlsX [Anaerolineae bacterium]|nr:phosphate acyltransferase PlsX [Anaerolineae bacterium]MDW8100887.1 phosphate acyltransferase PlsX [Anaerolineae bacterium]
MRIALDAMGGDYAPGATVAGAVQAARAYGLEVILVGNEARIRAELRQHDTRGLRLPIVHTSQVVAMDEHTMAVKQKRDASMVVAMRLVREGQADAFASAGNSGAVMAAALFTLGRIPGIIRPALATIYPMPPHRCILLDIGANADCKPEHLLQFAIMGAVYAERVHGILHPRVGIISNGEEPEKGSILVREAFSLLAASGLNFVGNIEGKDLHKHVADVVVTDGFTGNVVIKLTEGVVAFLARLLARQLTGTWRDRLGLCLMAPGLVLALPGLLLMSPTLWHMRRQLDWREIGGAPLLGVNGVVIIGHGRSDPYAIRHMIRQAMVAAEQGLVAAIREGIQHLIPILDPVASKP